MNTFGQIFTLTSFGESHGTALGGVVDGMPAGIPIDVQKIQHELDRRRPGQNALVTPRNEADRVQLLSGVFEGVSTGTPIGFIVENTNQHSSDYENMRHIYRPSHGDFTYQAKYGIRDHRGGGRTSARETLSRVVAGALAKQALEQVGITISAYASSIGNVERTSPGPLTDEMAELIARVKAEGNSVGGVVTCIVKGCPAGLGEPVFDKLSARLASAMMSINAAKGFEIGMGFEGSKHLGSEVIDNWVADAYDPRGMHAATNNSGGIQAGISNGEDIVMRVAFKPVATLLRDVDTVDDKGNAAVLKAKGRHDPCVVPRAIPVVEAMAAMTLLDAYLLNKTVHL
jgi:chorismate synthase